MKRLAVSALTDGIGGAPGRHVEWRCLDGKAFEGYVVVRIGGRIGEDPVDLVDPPAAGLPAVEFHYVSNSREFTFPSSFVQQFFSRGPIHNDHDHLLTPLLVQTHITSTAACAFLLLS